MKTIFQIFAILLIGYSSYGQGSASSFIGFHLNLPNDTLLQKNEISRIEAIDYYQDGTSELSEIWHVDTSGLIRKHELIGNDIEDSLPQYSLYKYVEKKIVSEFHVGEWNTYGKLDTILKTYNYYKNGLLRNVKTEGVFSYEVEHVYKDMKILYEVKTDSTRYGQIWIDSNIYNVNDQIIRTVFSKNEVYWLYRYDENNELIEKVLYSLHDSTHIYSKYIFKYENRNLIIEEGLYSHNGKKENQNKTIYRYYYDKNDLVIKVEKLVDGHFIRNREYKYYKE